MRDLSQHDHRPSAPFFISVWTSTPSSRKAACVYRQILDPVTHSLAWSSLVAALPLALLFVMLGVLRVRAWVASVASLAGAIVIAIAVYGMPIGQAALAGAEGAVFGFFPILWIVINAIWLYQMTVETGHFDVLRRSFATVSDDHRIQAIIIAFSFGALLEALAGFGTPVAVTVGDAARAGFQTAQGGCPGAGRQHRAGRIRRDGHAHHHPRQDVRVVDRHARAPWSGGKPRSWRSSSRWRWSPSSTVGVACAKHGSAALAGGVVFGLGQYATSNFVSVPLADVIASLLSAGAVVSVVRIRPSRRRTRWRPGHCRRCRRRAGPRLHRAGREPRPAGPGAARVCAVRDRHCRLRGLPDLTR